MVLQIRLGLMAVLALMVGLFACAQGAVAKTCTPQDAEAADEIAGTKTDWHKVETAFKKYGHCYDGGIGEGYSEPVARMLVKQWSALPVLADLVKNDAPLEKFVLRHIDSTLDPGNLKKIRQLAATSCPDGLTALCGEIKSAAAHASGRAE
jgi:hypothetical protein